MPFPPVIHPSTAFQNFSLLQQGSSPKFVRQNNRSCDQHQIQGPPSFGQGTGKKSLEQQLEQLVFKFPDKARSILKFNTPLAHMITAGVDYMLVPSRFEPCGLIQLHAMRYGTVCMGPISCSSLSSRLSLSQIVL